MAFTSPAAGAEASACACGGGEAAAPTAALPARQHQLGRAACSHQRRQGWRRRRQRPAAAPVDQDDIGASRGVGRLTSPCADAAVPSAGVVCAGAGPAVAHATLAAEPRRQPGGAAGGTGAGGAHEEQAQRRRDALSASPTSSGGVRYATAQLDSFALHSANSSCSNSLHSGYAAGGMRHISIPGAADAAMPSLNATIGFSNPMGCYPDALSVATLSSGTSMSPAVAPDAVPAQHLDSSRQQPWHDEHGRLLAHISGGSAGSDGPCAAAHLPGSARGRPDSALVDAHTMIMRYDRVDPTAAFAMAQSALDTEVRLLPSEV